jgi:hypothetical protein
MNSQAEVEEQRSPLTRRDSNEQRITDNDNIPKFLSDLELEPTS